LAFTATLLDVPHSRECGDQAGKFACCALGKTLNVMLDFIFEWLVGCKVVVCFDKLHFAISG